jgi:hypothetical protein
MVADKLDCSRRFFGDMKAVCGRAYPELVCPAGRIGILNCPKWRLEKSSCYGWARVYFGAVNFDSELYIGGVGPYKDPQRLQACIGCPTIP